MYRTAACIAATGVSINVFACLAVLHATVLVQFYAWEAALAGWAVTYLVCILLYSTVLEN
jgi:hypothetical protein